MIVSWIFPSFIHNHSASFSGLCMFQFMFVVFVFLSQNMILHRCKWWEYCMGKVSENTSKIQSIWLSVFDTELLRPRKHLYSNIFIFFSLHKQKLDMNSVYMCEAFQAAPHFTYQRIIHIGQRCAGENINRARPMFSPLKRMHIIFRLPVDFWFISFFLGNLCVYMCMFFLLVTFCYINYKSSNSNSNR